jgi:hypothetical protein
MSISREIDATHYNIHCPSLDKNREVWNNINMPKRSSKETKQDINQIAVSIVWAATGEVLPIEKPKPQKNPAAVALGRLGGLKGGKARAEKLSPEERKKIAKEAAQQRWSKKNK